MALTFSDVPIRGQGVDARVKTNWFDSLREAGVNLDLTAGSGSGGINHVVGTSADAESGLGDWVTYADAAGTTPVDGAGGIAASTLGTATSPAIRGAQSFDFSKDASNRQGEGVSLDFTIDEKDASQQLEISFDLQATANFVSGANSDIKVFLYDVTNTAFINLEDDNGILTADGSFFARFIASSSTSYRLIFHVVTTSSLAYNLYFDTVRVGPETGAVNGAIIKGWEDFTPTGSWTTNTTYTGKKRRVGDSAEYLVEVLVSGAPNASSLFIDVPSEDGVIDTTKINNATSNSSNLGSARLVNSGVAHVEPATVAYQSSTEVVVFGGGTAPGAAVSDTSPFTWASADTAWVRFTVPIVGWDTNAVFSNATEFRISNYLQNGSRVTAIPTAIGEYRSMLRDAAANTHTDTSGDPTTAPTIADGVVLYNGNAFSAADTNNEPTYYQIFCGKNKVVRPQFYSTTGKDGDVSCIPIQNSATESRGYNWGYIEATGLFTISAHYGLGSETAHISGHGTGTNTTNSNINDVYFDLIVSEKALAHGVETVDAELIMNTGNGAGAVNTAVRRFANIQSNTSGNYTVTQDSNSGDSFQILTSGLYSMSYSDRRGGGPGTYGVSLNSTELTTDIFSITAADRLGVTVLGSSEMSTVFATKRLAQGDIIRAHINPSAAPDDTSAGVQFRIIKIAN